MASVLAARLDTGTIRTGDRTAAVVAALDAGREPAADPAVQRNITAAAVAVPGTAAVGRKPDGWGAVLAGHQLALPTSAEYRSRVAAIEARGREVRTVIDRGRSHVAGREVRVPAA